MITILLEKIKALLIELKTNIENMPKGGGDYSTDEVECGTWIDGKKIYSKTMEFTTLNSGDNYKNPPIPMTEIDKFIDYDGYLYSNNGMQVKLNPFATRSQDAFYIRDINTTITNIIIYVGSTYNSHLSSGHKCYITFKYTKKTLEE